MINKRKKRTVKPFSFLFAFLTYLSITIICTILFTIVGYILINGIPHLSWKVVFGEYSSSNPSMRFAIVTTLILIVLTLLVAVPISIFSSIYLTEYTKKGSKLVKLIRLATETLAGIPSIVYGLFGSIFFGTVLGLGYSLLTGILTMTIMVLPVIIRSTEESIKAVPDTYREASYGLGATKLRTIFKVVLPSATMGILSSIVLSMGRIIGETAALIFTLGTVTQMPNSLLDSSRSLAIHMYILTSDGGIEGRNIAFATGVVLIILVILVNILATFLANKIGGKKAREK